MEKISSVRGMRDILPKEIGLWQVIENTARNIFKKYGYKEIRTPLLEKTDLFIRSIGADTDIVEKEMYTFLDRNGESLTLRPEATASILRAYIQHHIHKEEPVSKLFTMGPMFRYERPQKGRFRQFHQLNMEILGEDSPYADAEAISILHELMVELGLSEWNLHLNSLGCIECRKEYRTKLKEYLETITHNLCPDCKKRKDKNPLRFLDCKNETCKPYKSAAPKITDYLCKDCKEHIETLKMLLDKISIPYEMDPYLVRGLDYYQRTTFELVSDKLGSQSAIAGGGRYDGLIRDLGGPDMPGLGFAIGMERLVEVLTTEKEAPKEYPDIFIAYLGDRAKKIGFSAILSLRKEGLYAEMSFKDKSLKGQLRLANRMGAKKVAIIGDEEIAKNIFILRDMVTKEQEIIPMEKMGKASVYLDRSEEEK